jgi:hypothetical protein
MATIACGDTTLVYDGECWEAEQPIVISTQESRIGFVVYLESKPESLVQFLTAQLDRARRCAVSALDALRDDYAKGEDSDTFQYIELHRVELPDLGLQQSIAAIAEFMEVTGATVYSDKDIQVVVDVAIKGGVTNNLLAVRFDEDATVVNIAQES